MKYINDSWLEILKTCITTSGGLGEHISSQFATVSGPKSGKLEGRPACRTVIIRKVENPALYFGTCAGSLKLDDVSNGPSQYAELCWYFEKTRTQFRISVFAEEDADVEVKKEVWETYTDLEKKRLYYADVEVDEEEEIDHQLLSVVPDFFRVVRLTPNFVRILDLGEKAKAAMARNFEMGQNGLVEVFGRELGP